MSPPWTAWAAPPSPAPTSPQGGGPPETSPCPLGTHLHLLTRGRYPGTALPITHISPQIRLTGCRLRLSLGPRAGSPIRLFPPLTPGRPRSSITPIPGTQGPPSPSLAPKPLLPYLSIPDNPGTPSSVIPYSSYPEYLSALTPPSSLTPRVASIHNWSPHS